MKLALHWQIVIGLVLGIAAGLIINQTWDDGTWARLGVQDRDAYILHHKARVPVLPEGVTSIEQVPPSQRVYRDANADSGLRANVVRFGVNLTWFVGEAFLRCLRFIAVPIVLFSLIVGAASLGDLRKVGRIGGKTVGIYLATTAIAVVIGLTYANIIQPGNWVGAETQQALMAKNAAAVAERAGEIARVSNVWQQLVDLVPANPFNAVANAAMLQVIVAALAIGMGLTMIPAEKARYVIGFCDAMTDVIVKLVHLIMRAAPYAVFALMVPTVAGMGLDILAGLGAYCGVLLLGLATLLLVEYPLLLRLFSGVRFRHYFRAMAPAQLLAFSTSSSSATLPVTMDCVQNRLGVSEEITSFVCPLGATINMDGTAMYQGVAALFVAQMSGVDLSLSQQLVVVLTAVLASIGTPGIPGAGIIMLVIVLEAVGLPPEGIGVILAVDRLMDMCRTMINVSGDGMTAALVARSEGETLEPPMVSAAT